MYIKVFNNEDEIIFSGDSEDFLDENNWDEELEELLSELDTNKTIKVVKYHNYTIEKVVSVYIKR